MSSTGSAVACNAVTCSQTEGEEELAAVNAWVKDLGLKTGEVSFDYADETTGEQVAVFDLVWPNGLQEGLTEPVALLLNEGEDTLAVANSAGFRCFTSTEAFRRYVSDEVMEAV